MNDIMDNGIVDPRVLATELQRAIDKSMEENDRALEWASKEINRYRNLLIYMIKSQINQPIYIADPEWKKIETHTITGVKIGKQEDGHFGEEYNGDTVVKILIDNDEKYYIADMIGQNIFFSKEEAQKIAGSALN